MPTKQVLRKRFEGKEFEFTEIQRDSPPPPEVLTRIRTRGTSKFQRFFDNVNDLMLDAVKGNKDESVWCKYEAKDENEVLRIMSAIKSFVKKSWQNGDHVVQFGFHNNLLWYRVLNKRHKKSIV